MRTLKPSKATLKVLGAIDKAQARSEHRRDKMAFSAAAVACWEFAREAGTGKHSAADVQIVHSHVIDAIRNYGAADEFYGLPETFRDILKVRTIGEINL